MISYYRYTFSEYELENILNNNNIILNRETFCANDNLEYELVITGEGYYLNLNGETISKIYPYEKCLLLHSVAKIDVSEDHTIYLLLDSEKNRPVKRNFHIDRLNYITSMPISAEYIELLASNINFNNDEEFLLLCFLYLIFRLDNTDDLSLNLYFRCKLDYYGYDEEDLYNKVPFNNSKNNNFTEIVNLALEVLVNYNKYETLDLENYSIYMIDLKTKFLKFYHSL